jgi:hypothetical protein
MLATGRTPGFLISAEHIMDRAQVLGHEPVLEASRWGNAAIARRIVACCSKDVLGACYVEQALSVACSVRERTKILD